jgi:hypothetical protein
MAQKYKTLGVVEEGNCQHCGAACPRRRLAVAPLDAHGNVVGDPVYVGCVCAAELTSGRRSRSVADRLLREAEEADRQAELHRVDRERRFEFRVAGRWHADVDPASRNPRDSANARYRATGRPLHGSYFAQDSQGRIVRVDGQDPADVELFENRGFCRISEPVS